MKLLVIDLEATCWAASPWQDHEQPPPEIIEVGGAVLDTHTAGIGPTFSWFVKPRLGQITGYCTELTSITQEQVDAGLTFQEAMLKLEEVQQENRTKAWASWGEWDRTMIYRQCKRESIKDRQVAYPMSYQHVNIKLVEALLRGGKQKSLGEALELHGMKFQGRPHRGLDDAVNTAMLFAKLMKDYRCGASL